MRQGALASPSSLSPRLGPAWLVYPVPGFLPPRHGATFRVESPAGIALGWLVVAGSPLLNETYFAPLHHHWWWREDVTPWPHAFDLVPTLDTLTLPAPQDVGWLPVPADGCREALPLPACARGVDYRIAVRVRRPRLVPPAASPGGTTLVPPDDLESE